jgi:hypothetical protein
MVAMDNVTYYNGTTYWDGFDLLGTDETILQRLVDGRFERLSALDCLNSYAVDFQSSWGDLLIVADADTPVGKSTQPSVLWSMEVGGSNFNDTWHYSPPYPWICGQIGPASKIFCPNHVDSFRQNISSWIPMTYPVGYCLAEPQTENCRVQTDLSIGLISGILSLANVVILCIVLLAVRQNPLLTTGDAVLSFMATPDAETKGMCLIDRDEAARICHQRKKKSPWMEEASDVLMVSSPRPFQAKTRRWAAALSKQRWLLFSTWYVTAPDFQRYY